MCALPSGPEGWNGMIPLGYKAGECPVPYTRWNGSAWQVQDCQATHLVAYNTCLRCARARAHTPHSWIIHQAQASGCPG